jgi:transposase-like protein
MSTHFPLLSPADSVRETGVAPTTFTVNQDPTMEDVRLSSDGKRLYSREFKRQQIARVLRNEVTFAALAKELKTDPSTVRQWLASIRKRPNALGDTLFIEPGSEELRNALGRIRELEQLVVSLTQERSRERR